MEQLSVPITKEDLLEVEIPTRTTEALDRYIHQGLLPGSFLTAILENNLKVAYMNADSENFVAIPALLMYIYNYVPGDCWGTPRRVADWLDHKGMAGKG